VVIKSKERCGKHAWIKGYSDNSVLWHCVSPRQLLRQNHARKFRLGVELHTRFLPSSRPILEGVKVDRHLGINLQAHDGRVDDDTGRNAVSLGCRNENMKKKFVEEKMTEDMCAKLEIVAFLRKKLDGAA
jgi:hypothetical protein